MDDAERDLVLKNLDNRLQAVEQILPTLVTDAKLEAAIAPLATKVELAAAIGPLATKAELQEVEDRLRRHFDVVGESLRADIRLIAEGLALLGERVDRGFEHVRRELGQLDRRVGRLEVSR